MWLPENRLTSLVVLPISPVFVLRRKFVALLPGRTADASSVAVDLDSWFGETFCVDPLQAGCNNLDLSRVSPSNLRVVENLAFGKDRNALISYSDLMPWDWKLFDFFRVISELWIEARKNNGIRGAGSKTFNWIKFWISFDINCDVRVWYFLKHLKLTELMAVSCWMVFLDLLSISFFLVDCKEPKCFESVSDSRLKTLSSHLFLYPDLLPYIFFHPLLGWRLIVNESIGIFVFGPFGFIIVIGLIPKRFCIRRGGRGPWKILRVCK